MEVKKVIGIVQTAALEKVQNRLHEMGIKGLSVSSVKGYGEYKDILRENWLVTHARIEIFTEKTKADEIADAIMNVAHTGGPGDGIVCILPVEKIFRIRTRSEAKPDEI